MTIESKFRHLFFFWVFINLSSYSFSQLIFDQGIVYGGVTAAGYSTGQGFGSGSFDIYIEPGSTIKKAYAFTYRIGYPPPATFIFNGNPYLFDTNNVVMDVDYAHPYASPIQLYYLDVTDDINPSQLNHTITIPDQFGLPINWGYWTFFLYIVYENPTLPLCSQTIIINEQDFLGNESYSISDLNAVNTNFPVGFSLYSDRTGSGFVPTNEVYFNSNFLGTIGGSDNINSSWVFAGVKGHFDYQNNQLFGLDDDTADNLMDITDGLADVSGLMANNATSCDFQMIHTLFPNQPDSYNNDNLAFFLVYTSPCDTFSVTVPNDTTICYGEQLQLNVTGPPGAVYEWSAPSSASGGAVPGLSCSDCPNPVFTADSSMFYTVRIWNNDSCSVVRPLKINVNRTIIDTLMSTPPDCGATNGSIEVMAHSTLYDDLTYSLNGGAWQAGNVFQGIGEGTYTVSIQNASGCPVVDTTIFIQAVNNTIAQFGLTPSSGEAPLEVELYNNSQNATDYAWYINGDYISNQLDNYTLENGGDYTIELVAWQYDPSCADTFSMIVLVSEVIIPTAFTPNNDGVNDTWEILQLNDYFPDNTVSIYDRWGSLIYQKENGTYPNEPWDGTYNSEALPTGSYFYIIEPNDGNTEAFEGSVSIIRE